MDEAALQGLHRLWGAGYLDQRTMDNVQEAIEQAEANLTAYRADGTVDSQKSWLDAEMKAWHILTVAVSLGTTQAALDDFRRRQHGRT